MNTFPSTKSDFSLWVGLLGAPTIWLINLQTNYLLVLYVCKGGPHSALFISALIWLGLAAGIIVLSLINFKSIPEAPDDDVVLHARKFLAKVSIFVSILFFLIILAQAIPNFILDPCVF
jgi:hypothetical protein